ncbi:MAG TPA: hypothetical protein VH740_25680 [Vicinamibacterales bacterium]|jgi:hypothetical protein
MRRSFSNSSKTSSSAAILLALAVSAGSACGGSGGSGGGNNPPPAGGGETTCATASLEPDVLDSKTAAELEQVQQAKRERFDGDPRNRHLDSLWLHRSRADRIRTRTSLTEGRESIDVGEIAVIQDEGDLIESPNPYDLRNVGLRYARNAAGGYDITRLDGEFRTGLGSRINLSDDDSTLLNVPFGFSFYGRNQTVAFINSDGNITFEEEDRASTDRNISRLLTGPPRVALFLADLDPSAGGRIFANAASDRYTVTWCGVRGFDSTRTMNAQVTLLPSGVIEMKFGEVGLAKAIVGVSPGRTGEFTPVNLSDGGPLNGGAAAVGERFADAAQLDIVELARKFYRTHADNFDQLVIWTDTSLIDDAFAFESTVANEVRGIGMTQFDASRDFGSAGRLRSFTMMDWIGKYPEDPQQTFLGENNTVSVLGQEVGHRWLAFMEFRNHAGVRSDALLGRDQSHWSFFFDSDASVMEGNDIEDLGGGSFRTVGAVRRYSMLDQYAMGLVTDSQVPSFFYVDNPVNVSGSRDATSAPRIGVTFNGTRRDVLIQDIVAIHGPRLPLPADTSKIHRQAFLLVVGAGRSPDNGQIAKLDRIRRAWETFFRQATDNRMQAVTTLR